MIDSPLASVERDVARTIGEHQLIEGDQLVQIAFSGGVDSVVLTHVLHRLGYRLALTMIDHQNRPLDRERALLVQLASRLAVAQLVEPVLVGQGPSWEAHARDARYAALAITARHHGSGVTATGHNMGDQAETVLMRLARGCGLDGLTGIHCRRDDGIVRPLLEITRERIAAYATAAGLSWCEDPTNRSDRFLRNRVRHELLPLWGTIFGDNAIERVAKLAGRIRGEQQWLDDHVRQLLQTISVPDESGGLRIDLRQIRETNTALLRRLFALLVGPATLTERHFCALHRLLTGPAGSKRLNLPGGMVAEREYHYLTLRRSPIVPSAVIVPQELALPGEIALLQGRLRLFETPTPPADLDERQRVVFDGDALAPPLELRGIQRGDSFCPLGGPGTRRVSRMLIDRKVPMADRQSLALLADTRGILWLCGHRRSNRALISAQTTRYVTAELLRR